jgi:hypothetical protein
MGTFVRLLLIAACVFSGYVNYEQSQAITIQGRLIQLLRSQCQSTVTVSIPR